ncbi:MAG: hypothetical protein HKM24_04435 [Gammaproteobacteria bacterium]|nr:hypothetical protein [Gammaproteobacteria bacterium]
MKVNHQPEMAPGCAAGALLWGVCAAIFVMAAKAPTNFFWSLLMAFGALFSVSMAAIFLLCMLGKIDFVMEKLAPLLLGYVPEKVDVD